MKNIISIVVMLFGITSIAMATPLHDAIIAEDYQKVKMIIFTSNNPKSLCKANKAGYAPHELASNLYYAADGDADRVPGNIMSLLRGNRWLGFDCDRYVMYGTPFPK